MEGFGLETFNWPRDVHNESAVDSQQNTKSGTTEAQLERKNMDDKRFHLQL